MLCRVKGDVITAGLTCVVPQVHLHCSPARGACWHADAMQSGIAIKSSSSAAGRRALSARRQVHCANIMRQMGALHGHACAVLTKRRRISSVWLTNKQLNGLLSRSGQVAGAGCIALHVAIHSTGPRRSVFKSLVHTMQASIASAAQHQTKPSGRRGCAAGQPARQPAA